MAASSLAVSRDDRFSTKEERKSGDDRSPAQRDRDRIIYSSAFRRLTEVTQVVAADNAHVFHNRLTHSLQVAQVGRRIAEKLLKKQAATAHDVGGIDPDVVEAACLAHDLGHPPFGHLAEEELNRLAKGAVGGFEGNAQSFRIVTKLAFRSTAYAGLNLTRATLNALLKYPWQRNRNTANRGKWGAYDSEAKEFTFARALMPGAAFQRSAEAEIMDWADDVTYSVHDIEDFYRAGRVPLHLLATGDSRETKAFFDGVFERRNGASGVWQRFTRSEFESAFQELLPMHFRLDEAYNGTKDHRSRLRSFTLRLIGRYINGLELQKPNNAKAPRVSIDDEFIKEVAMLKELTWHYIIMAPALATQQAGQREIVRGLFHIFSEAAESASERRLFPAYYQEAIRDGTSLTERRRIVVDMIAGMTEVQAITLYQRLMGINLGSGLESVLN